jgi:hypothetical protein
MLSEKQIQPDSQIPESSGTPLYHSDVFERIHIDYYALYMGVEAGQLLATIRRGIANKLLQTNLDRQSATHWQEGYQKALTRLSKQLTVDLLQQTKQLPVIGLQELSDNPVILLKILSKNPNDYLCHFQLAWLQAKAGNLTLAERHYNVAALQSKEVNPQFSCFAFRHLSDVRYRAGKHMQALLAIESARECSKGFNAELQFEYVRMLSITQRTTLALKQLNILISKAPHYEVLMQYEPNLRENPSILRRLNQLTQQHQQNVHNNLLLQWENDPLRLLDLDRELGQTHSLEALRDKQQHTLEHLPHLLIQDEAYASKLVQLQSRRFVMNTLDVRKQNYIEQIEEHQGRAERIHYIGQWLVYTMVITLMSLALSYGISTVVSFFSFDWPVNQTVQSLVLIIAAVVGVSGMLLLHFSPKKLSRLLKQKQQLEQLSSRIGVSA